MFTDFFFPIESNKRHNEDMYNLGKKCWYEHGEDEEAKKVIEHAKYWGDDKAGILKDEKWVYWLNGYNDAKEGK